MKYLLAVCLLICFITDDAEARRFRRSRSRVTTRVTQSVASHGTAQQVAERKVQLLARLDRLFHPGGGFGGGHFEGVGYSYNANSIPTCTTNRGRVIGDARARSRSGRWYRVRIWGW